MKAKLKKIIKYSPTVALGVVTSLTMIACMYAGVIHKAYTLDKQTP
jgi:hypothetical protein